jgi:hypothetical protein
MVIDGPSGANADDQARRLALALDVIEAQLERLDLGADPHSIVHALAAPIRAFDAAAKEA